MAELNNTLIIKLIKKKEINYTFIGFNVTFVI